MSPLAHQYIDRETSAVRTERLFADRLVNFLYGPPREQAAWLFRQLTSSRASEMLAYLNYEVVLNRRGGRSGLPVKAMDIDVSECVLPPSALNTPRKIFERQLRYWDVRPMEDDPRAVVSPADARVLCGSLRESSTLFLKNKFFDVAELIGRHKTLWYQRFAEGDVAIFRLTPDKYHYNHLPVSGQVLDIYEVDGAYHSCNPGPIVQVVTPYSKNRRVVTILDTDVPGGSQAGLVAMIEVVALMIGDIVQCYSDRRYDDPRPVRPGMMVSKGQPKSLYRPGSSTDVLLFQRGRVEFCEDLLANMLRPGVRSRFSKGFGRPLVETDLTVRSTIGYARAAEAARGHDGQ
jgi:phosphatidylserine decarboxylase